MNIFEEKETIMSDISDDFQASEANVLTDILDSPVLQDSSLNDPLDSPIDICGSDAKCCNCSKIFYIPHFYPPHVEEHEVKVSNGAFEHFFGYECSECRAIPNLLDIIMAKNNLCFLSDYTIRVANTKMDYPCDRISRIAEWSPEYGGWCFNWYTIPNSSIKPLVGDSFLSLFKSYDVYHCSLLKKLPGEVLKIFIENGIRGNDLPYRKMKVYKK